MAWRSGEMVLARYVWRGKVFFAGPNTVVEDTAQRLVLFTPMGAPVMRAPVDHHAGTIGEDAFGDLRTILDEALTRIRTEVFEPDQAQAEEGSAPAPDPGGPPGTDSGEPRAETAEAPRAKSGGSARAGGGESPQGETSGPRQAETSGSPQAETGKSPQAKSGGSPRGGRRTSPWAEATRPPRTDADDDAG